MELDTEYRRESIAYYNGSREPTEDAHESSDGIDDIELLVIGLLYCRYELNGGKNWFY